MGKTRSRHSRHSRHYRKKRHTRHTKRGIDRKRHKSHRKHRKRSRRNKGGVPVTNMSAVVPVTNLSAVVKDAEKKATILPDDYQPRAIDAIQQAEHVDNEWETKLTQELETKKPDDYQQDAVDIANMLLNKDTETWDVMKLVKGGGAGSEKTSKAQLMEKLKSGVRSFVGKASWARRIIYFSEKDNMMGYFNPYKDVLKQLGDDKKRIACYDSLIYKVCNAKVAYPELSKKISNKYIIFETAKPFIAYEFHHGINPWKWSDTFAVLEWDGLLQKWESMMEKWYSSTNHTAATTAAYKILSERLRGVQSSPETFTSLYPDAKREAR